MYTWRRAADQFTVPQQGPGGDKKKARERKTNKRLVGLLKEEMKGARAFLERWRFSKSLALSDSGFLEMKGAERRVRKGGTAAISTDPNKEVSYPSFS